MLICAARMQNFGIPVTSELICNKSNEANKRHVLSGQSIDSRISSSRLKF